MPLHLFIIFLKIYQSPTIKIPLPRELGDGRVGLTDENIIKTLNQFARFY